MISDSILKKAEEIYNACLSKSIIDTDLLYLAMGDVTHKLKLNQSFMEEFSEYMRLEYIDFDYSIREMKYSSIINRFVECRRKIDIHNLKIIMQRSQINNSPKHATSDLVIRLRLYFKPEDKLKLRLII